MRTLIDELRGGASLDREDFASLIRNRDAALQSHAAHLARETTNAVFGNRIFIRGLIEFTNFCKNDCFYCGIRNSNLNTGRFRLDKETILSCCRYGYELGFRTFVLQGGEDEQFDDEILTDIVQAVRRNFIDCAITLSVGERNEKSYRRLFCAGANRYLLRHETASPEHYALLHPESLSLESRKRCLWTLKKIGFQTGSGFMVGTPWQTPENLADDLLFLRELEPEMVGIGPFIPHKDTPFADSPAGSSDLTVFLLSLIRLMLPRTLLPATTALATLDPSGREKAILAGANVIMPNLSPLSAREQYMLYDNKARSGLEAAEHLDDLRRRLEVIGYRIVEDRGDYPEEGFGAAAAKKK